MRSHPVISDSPFALRVSGGGAQGVEQATNVRGGHADTAVGGTIGEAHVVTVAVCSLDEHDVVHVAPALPVELRLEEWLGKWLCSRPVAWSNSAGLIVYEPLARRSWKKSKSPASVGTGAPPHRRSYPPSITGGVLHVNDIVWSSLVATVSVTVRRERADLDESELEVFLDRSQLGLHTLGPALGPAPQAPGPASPAGGRGERGGKGDGRRGTRAERAARAEGFGVGTQAPTFARVAAKRPGGWSGWRLKCYRVATGLGEVSTSPGG